MTEELADGLSAVSAIKRHVDRLAGLFADPQLGLATWGEMVRSELDGLTEC